MGNERQQAGMLVKGQQLELHHKSLAIMNEKEKPETSEVKLDFCLLASASELKRPPGRCARTELAVR
jgi:hypothetical protein